MALQAATAAATTTTPTPFPLHPPPIEYECHPCLDRGKISIVAVLPKFVEQDEDSHNVYEEISLVLEEVGRNMRISKMEIIRPSTIEEMVQEILALTTSSDSDQDYNGLVVSIPTDAVEEAVKEVIRDSIIPVWGIQDGSWRTPNLQGMMGFVSMDDVQAGQVLANHLLELTTSHRSSSATSETNSASSSSRWLVISADPLEDTPETRSSGQLNSYLRLQGIQNALQELEYQNQQQLLAEEEYQATLTNTTNSTLPPTPEFPPGLVLEELQLKDANNNLDEVMENCPFDAIIWIPGYEDNNQNQAEALDSIIQSYTKHTCSFKDQVLVAFDTNPQIYKSISRGEVTFTISQDQYLQANLVGVMAILYATTGHALQPPTTTAASNPFGIYQTGARIIDLKSMPNDQEQICERLAHPSCPIHKGQQLVVPQLPTPCPCRDRSQIRIAGIYHDDRAQPAIQAAQDLGVTLIMDRVKAVGNKKERMTQLANKIKAYCLDRVDGVFTQVKHVVQAEAIQFCQQLNIPVFGVLPVISQTQSYLEQPIHTIGMNDYEAGYQMTQQLLQRGMQFGYCINWSGAKQLLPRCSGMEAAIQYYAATQQQQSTRRIAATTNNNAISAAAAPQYMGILHGVSDNKEQMKVILEDGIDSNIVGGDNWDGVGLLMTGYKFTSGAKYAQETHPGLIFGTEGFSDLVYESLDDGSLVATTDLQQYLRGYFPIVLLALLTPIGGSRQALQTHFLSSGPKLIFESPTPQEAQCMETKFSVCPPQQEKHHLDTIRPVGYTILALLLAFALYCIGWVTINRNVRIVRASQPLFLGAICMGCIFMAVTIVPLSLDDGLFMDNGGCVGCDCTPCSISCMASPWLFTTGFTIVFASLFSKIWRINRLMSGAAKFRRLKLSVVDVIKPFAVLLFLNVLCNLIWTIVDPMYYERSSRCGDDDGFTSYGTCKIGKGSVSKAMASCLLVINFCAVAMANYQAYHSRNLRTEFNESNYIALSMVCIMQVMLVGAPLIFLVTDSPEALFFVQTGIITIICASILGLLFVPKMRIHREDLQKKKKGDDSKKKNDAAYATATSGGDAASVGGSSAGSSTFGASVGLKIRQRKIRFSSFLPQGASISNVLRRDSDESSLRRISILPFGSRNKNKSATGTHGSRSLSNPSCSNNNSCVDMLDKMIVQQQQQQQQSPSMAGIRDLDDAPALAGIGPPPGMGDGDGLIISIAEEVESSHSNDHQDDNNDNGIQDYETSNITRFVMSPNPNPNMPMLDESMSSNPGGGGPMDAIVSVRDMVLEEEEADHNNSNEQNREDDDNVHDRL